jgi:hypothetical protein
MPPAWYVKLTDQAGLPVAIFDQWDDLVVEQHVNAPATYALHFTGDGNDARWALFQPDSQLEFWREDPSLGIAWRLEGEAFHRDEDRYTDASGLRHFVSSGRGYVDLLKRTLTEDPAGSAGSSKAGQAETVLKEYVNEQAGPGAGARARLGLTVQADAAGGNAIELARAYSNLLEVCQYIASIGGGDFDVIGTGPATFEFRWYLGQRGTDRIATIVFSEALGNMTEPHLTIRRSELANAVLVGGQGEQADRALVWRTDPASIGETPWGRVERFRDARNLETAGGLDDQGDEELAQNRRRITFAFKVVQTPGCQYGLHYFLGDLVRARYNAVDYIRKVDTVRLTVKGGANPEETIEVELTEALRVNPVAYYDADYYNYALWS